MVSGPVGVGKPRRPTPRTPSDTPRRGRVLRETSGIMATLARSHADRSWERRLAELSRPAGLLLARVQRRDHRGRCAQTARNRRSETARSNRRPSSRQDRHRERRRKRRDVVRHASHLRCLKQLRQRRRTGLLPEPPRTLQLGLAATGHRSSAAAESSSRAREPHHDPLASDDSCLTKVHVTSSKLRSMLSRLATLNSVLGHGAEAAGFATSLPDFDGHGLCDRTPYVPGCP